MVQIEGEFQYRWLSQEDQIKLFNLFPDADKPFFGFLFLSGCRPGEARAVKIKDVDLKTQSITIHATFSGRVYREKRKGRGAKPVTIPIHPEMLPYIIDRVKNNLPEAFLFPNPRTGAPYSLSAVDRVWYSVKEKAGLKNGLRLYDCTRHSFASNLVNSGTSVFKVSRLMGHSSIKMTERYSHENIESSRVEIEKLSLKGTLPKLSLPINLQKNS